MTPALPASWSDLLRLLSLVLLLGAAVALGGCNTIAGFGEDVEATGDAVSDTAEDVEEDM